jgi:hypothetical protein
MARAQTAIVAGVNVHGSLQRFVRNTGVKLCLARAIRR